MLVLLVGAATVFALDYHQARTNAHDKKVVAAERRAAAGVQFVGVVTSASPTSMVVRLASGAHRRVALTLTTRVENATTGAASDVRTARRGLVVLKPGFIDVAQEILVLPGNAELGQPIARAGFGYLWLREKGGALGTRLNMADATVDNAIAAATADLTAGARLLIHARTSTTRPIRFAATEIVMLPAGSAFR